MVSAMQPLTALQQLTALTFTCCEHGTADALPIAAMAALSLLVALDALDCNSFEPAGANQRQQLRERTDQQPTDCQAAMPQLPSCWAVQG